MDGKARSVVRLKKFGKTLECVETVEKPLSCFE